MVVEGLDPKTVSGGEELMLAFVPDDEREHAAQVLDAVRAVLLIKVDNAFRVAVSAIGVTLGEQFFSKFDVVVNFAVEYDPDGAVFVANWLMTSLDVDDAEAPHSESGIGN